MKNDKTMKAFAEKPEGVTKYKAISWPFYYWIGVINAEDIEELDPLQELVLNLIASNEYKKSELSKILGISKEVLSAVEEKCSLQGYLGSNKKLTKECLKKVNAVNYNEKDLEEADTGKKSIIFRDAVSGDIVPFFNMERVNNLTKTNDDVFELMQNQAFSKRPTFIDVKLGVKALKKLNRFHTYYEETYGVKMDDLRQEDIRKILELDEEDEDDEVYWEDDIEKANSHESIIVQKKENNADEKSKDTSLKDETALLKIKSINPKKISLEGYIYIHPDNIDEYFIRSPFGKRTDAWFLNKLRKEYSKNDDLKFEIKFLREEVIEKYKDTYSFNNDYDIDILDKIPKLANYKDYESVKREIVHVYKAYNRILDGHEDYDTYFNRVQRTLECLFQILVKQIDGWRQLCQNVYCSEYSSQIDRMSDELGINIPQKLKRKSICKNINNLKWKNSGAIKDRSMMLLLEAYYNKEEAFLVLCKQLPDFYEKILLIADMRNKHVHYNMENQFSRDDYIEKTKMIKNVFEDIVISLFNYYIGEKNNGKEK